MAKYEVLHTVSLKNNTVLQTQELPELVHLDDPARFVMTDFWQTPPHTISPSATMDKAISDMEIIGTHLLMVIDEARHFQGVICSEDVWGEKPIQFIQERRMQRDQLLVEMMMVPHKDIIALDASTLENVCVGNIVKTLMHYKQHYAVVVSSSVDHDQQIIRGIFTIAQISKQLHQDLLSEF